MWLKFCIFCFCIIHYYFYNISASYDLKNDLGVSLVTNLLINAANQLKYYLGSYLFSFSRIYRE